jgi:hypothetical protein
VKVFLQVLFYAAGHLCSVFAACSQLRDSAQRSGGARRARGFVPRSGILGA